MALGKCPVCKNISYYSETIDMGEHNYVGISCSKCNTMITITPMPILEDIYSVTNHTAQQLQELKQDLEKIGREIEEIKRKM